MQKNAPDLPSKNALNSFVYGAETKSLPVIDDLFTTLLPVSTPIGFKMKQKFKLSPTREQAGVLLLESGVYAFCHSESDIVVSTIFAPTVLGLIDAYSAFYDVPSRPLHYIYAETSGSGHFVPVDEFVRVLDEQNQWHDVAKVLAQRMIVMSIREKEFIGTDSYPMVRSLLLELQNYPEKYRGKINVLDFVLRRTGLSRSRIMSILAELRKGGYITINRGRLLSVDQKLPMVF